MLDPLHLIVEIHAIAFAKRIYPSITMLFVQDLVMAVEFSEVRVGIEEQAEQSTERILECQRITEP